MRPPFTRDYVQWIVGSLISIAILCGVFLRRDSSTSSPVPQALESDISRGWIPFGGSWKESSGSIENESEERGAKLMNGLTSWRDYFVEADVQLLGQFGEAGLVIRSNGEEEGVDSYHGYFAGIRNKDDVFLFGRGDFGWDQYAAKPLPVTINVGDWYHLKLAAVGCDIAASVEDDHGHVTRALAHDPRCISAGRMGLKSYSAGARWKNIKVGPADRTTLEGVSRDLSPVMIGLGRSPKELGFTDSALDRYMGPIRKEAKRQHFNGDTRTIASLNLLDPDSSPDVILHGVVTITSPVMYIQDPTGSIAVLTKHSEVPVKIGDEVEARGSIVFRNYTPILDEAMIRLLWPNVPTSPLAVSVFELASGEHNGRLVELEATFSSRQPNLNGTQRLVFSDGTQNFYGIAAAENTDRRFRTLAPGSRVRLRGVATYSPDFTSNLVPFAILLPSSGSFETIGLPSWWTPLHISLVSLVILLLALSLHVILLRIQRWRAQAVLEEREHLALDIHDTLAQSFAGIGFQLQAIRDETPATAPSRQHVEMALAMVRSSHDETRRSIAALRPAYLGQTDLLGSLCEYARRIIDDRSIAIESSTNGRALSIPLNVADAMFRIGQEAINNSIRHANASTLTITLTFERDVVSLTIKDDGCGFVSDVRQMGFGILGMEKRARDAGTQLQITSSATNGTAITISAQTRPHRTLARRIETAFRFILGT
jgi:signal transduction histidine kinase